MGFWDPGVGLVIEIALLDHVSMWSVILLWTEMIQLGFYVVVDNPPE